MKFKISFLKIVIRLAGRSVQSCKTFSNIHSYFAVQVWYYRWYKWDDINIPIKKNNLFTISTKLMITNKKNEFSFLHIFWWNYEAVCGVSTVKTKGVAHRHTHTTRATCRYIHTYILTTYFVSWRTENHFEGSHILSRPDA